MYFIYDCHGSVVGNPKGYRTFVGAERQANGKSKVSQTIWERFYARSNKDDRLVSSIKQR